MHENMVVPCVITLQWTIVVVPSVIIYTWTDYNLSSKAMTYLLYVIAWFFVLITLFRSFSNEDQKYNLPATLVCDNEWKSWLTQLLTYLSNKLYFYSLVF